MGDPAPVVRFTEHAKERLKQRICPLLPGEEGIGSAKDRVRSVVEEAIERNGFSRRQPDWVQRYWTQTEPEPKGSNVRFLRATIADHRFCIVVGYRKGKRRNDPPRWSVITVLPETPIHDREILRSGR